MNCKPGDLAVVVRAARGENIGIIVRVAALDSEWLEPVWRLAEAINRPGVSLADGSATRGITCCPDAWLRPIRDPGDDAVDETLQLIGLPDSAAIEWAVGGEG